MSNDPYKILGIPPDATAGEIKRAYRAAAQKYHPDTGGDAWVFQQVQDAYRELSQGHSEAERATQATSPSATRETSDDSTAPTARETQTASETESDGVLKDVASVLKQQLPLQSETCYFILANVLDIVLTNMLLNANAVEANPIAARVLEQWGFAGMIGFKMLLVAFLCVLAQIIAIRSMRHARFVLLGGTVIVGVVVAYSMWLYAFRIG